LHCTVGSTAFEDTSCSTEMGRHHKAS
jgi:hypothetical protein